MSTARNETGILLEQIDASLARISATLDQVDLIMQDIDQAAADPEQVAFETRVNLRCQWAECTSEAHYVCCECGKHLCWGHVFIDTDEQEYCSPCLPNVGQHLDNEQW